MPTLPTLVTLSEACRSLAISRRTFYRRWQNVFTAYKTDGGHNRIAMDELAEALKYPKNLNKARGAVALLRARLDRPS